jgi:hypothetical protein
MQAVVLYVEYIVHDVSRRRSERESYKSKEHSDKQIGVSEKSAAEERWSQDQEVLHPLLGPECVRDVSQESLHSQAFYIFSLF